MFKIFFALVVEFIICYVIELILSVPGEVEEELNTALLKEKDKQKIIKKWYKKNNFVYLINQFNFFIGVNSINICKEDIRYLLA